MRAGCVLGSASVMTKNTQKFHAFTLIELLMVLMIIGIVAAVAVPMLSGSSDLQLAAAVREVNATLLFAQSNAIATQQQCQVVFDVSANSYEIRDQDGVVIDDPTKIMPTGAANPDDYKFKVNFSNHSRFNKVSITSVSFDGSSIVWFDRLGMPYSGAISAKTPLNSGSVTLSADDYSNILSVEPVTGQIIIN